MKTAKEKAIESIEIFNYTGLPMPVGSYDEIVEAIDIAIAETNKLWEKRFKWLIDHIIQNKKRLNEDTTLWFDWIIKRIEEAKNKEFEE